MALFVLVVVVAVAVVVLFLWVGARPRYGVFMDGRPGFMSQVGRDVAEAAAAASRKESIIRVVILSRLPVPGHCKTRLAASTIRPDSSDVVGPILAANLQRNMTERVVRAARQAMLRQQHASTAAQPVEPSFVFAKPLVLFARDNKVLSQASRDIPKTLEEISRWLGPGVDVDWQLEGNDLGRKISQPFELAQAHNKSCDEVNRIFATLVVGSDIPDVNSDLFIRAACELLSGSPDDPSLPAGANDLSDQRRSVVSERGCDVVLGPAVDGGYYLVGVKQDSFSDALFDSKLIDWSTPKVLSQTLAICWRHHFKTSSAHLPKLVDIDDRSAVDLWSTGKSFQMNLLTSSHLEMIDVADAAVPPPLISVVIPVLNEEENIVATLTSVFKACCIEVVLVDGGSTDETVSKARRFASDYRVGTLECGVRDFKILTASKRGRGNQQNEGAAAARGQIVLFCHGDTLLPPGYDQFIRHTISLFPRMLIGAFSFCVNDPTASLPQWRLHFMERVTNFRASYFQLPYGDQSLFMTKASFEELGRFPAQLLMEDFDICRTAARRRRPKDRGVVVMEIPCYTHARRWQKLGMTRTWLTNQTVASAYMLGVSANTLAAWYYGKKAVAATTPEQPISEAGVTGAGRLRQRQVTIKDHA